MIYKSVMIRRWATVAITCAMAACDRSARRDARTDTTNVAAEAPAPDVMHLLDLDASVIPINVESHGTCISLDAARRSRVVYLMLPAESSYVRLAVVASHGPIDLVDLVRGIPDGRIWTATLDGSHATARLFKSASDKAPVTSEWPAGDQRVERLRTVATTAIQSPCTLQ
jgi:hypothetical protein